MVHAIALRPRARSIVRGVDPFYIRHTTPGGQWWSRDFCIQRFVTKKHCNSQYLESRSHCAVRNFPWKNIPCWDIPKVWYEESSLRLQELVSKKILVNFWEKSLFSSQIATFYFLPLIWQQGRGVVVALLKPSGSFAKGILLRRVTRYCELFTPSFKVDSSYF